MRQVSRFPPAPKVPCSITGTLAVGGERFFLKCTDVGRFQDHGSIPLVDAYRDFALARSRFIRLFYRSVNTSNGVFQRVRSGGTVLTRTVSESSVWVPLVRIDRAEEARSLPHYFNSH